MGNSYNNRNKRHQTKLPLGHEVAKGYGPFKAHEPNLIILMGSRRAAIREGIIEERKHMSRAKALTSRKLTGFRSIGTWVMK